MRGMLQDNVYHCSVHNVMFCCSASDCYALPCLGSRPQSSVQVSPIPAIEDYQQIVNNRPGNILPLDFEDVRHYQIFNLTIFEDGVLEGVEELNVTLSLQDPSLASKVIVRPAVATVRIIDSKFYLLPISYYVLYFIDR